MATKKKPKGTPPMDGLQPPPPFIKVSEDAANGVPEWPLPPTTPEETLRTKIADIHAQTDTLNLSRFNPPLAGELLAEYESLSAAGTTKPSEWAEFYIRAARVRAGLAVPTAPGETGNVPLTRPAQRNESKWQQ